METDDKEIIKDEISEKKSEAYERLFDTYIDEIKQRYMESETPVRLYLISKLEALANGKSLSDMGGMFFDGDKAREIRLKKSLTYRGLSKQLNVALASLTSYERGATVPRLTKGKGGRRYLEWLKNEGYDPFGLE
jgi:DNA-binding transcriptional regulator YiaG